MHSKSRLIYIAGGLAGVALGAWLLRSVPNGRAVERWTEAAATLDTERMDPLQDTRISEHAEV